MLDVAHLAPSPPTEQPFPISNIGALGEESFQVRALVERLMARRVVLENEVAPLLAALKETGLAEQGGRAAGARGAVPQEADP